MHWTSGHQRKTNVMRDDASHSVHSLFHMNCLTERKTFQLTIDFRYKTTGFCIDYGIETRRQKLTAKNYDDIRYNL